MVVLDLPEREADIEAPKKMESNYDSPLVSSTKPSPPGTSLLRCGTGEEVVKRLRSEFSRRQELFPRDPAAMVIVKPNLNSNLDALTGNTTDLRVLGATLTLLRESGYTNVTVADGPNGGFHRDGVSVFERNRVDHLAKRFGYRALDVNCTTSSNTVLFDASGEANIADIFCKCDFFVNIPKLKTHYETVMSVALKSLIGVLVGQYNKSKAHASLIENILRLNDRIQANLHIVDGLVAMEGTGPSAGTPIRMDILIVGTDPYEIDILAGRVAGFAPSDLPLIRHALDTGRINSDLIQKVAALDVNGFEAKFAPAKPRLLARLAVAPAVKGLVRTIRNSPPVDRLLKNERVRRRLFAVGLTQEVILRRERRTTIVFDSRRCKSCGKCARYCPLLRALPDAFGSADDDCLDCLYCYEVCPSGAIRLQGDPGYYSEQQRRYGRIVREIA